MLEGVERSEKSHRSSDSHARDIQGSYVDICIGPNGSDERVLETVLGVWLYPFGLC